MVEDHAPRCVPPRNIRGQAGGVEETAKRSKCATPPQSFLTDQHPIYGGKAEVVRTQQSGRYWHFRMWISEERKYVRKTLKATHLDTAVERAENEFFAIKVDARWPSSIEQQIDIKG